MKRFMAILLALLLLSAAALAEVDDGFGYVDRFTLEDGTVLPVAVEHKTDWEYDTFEGTGLIAKDIPVYTVTVPEGTQNVQIYLSEAGRAAFGQNAALYSYVYVEESDSLDTSVYAANIENQGEYYLASIQKYDYAWELSDWTVGAILKLRVGELPNPEQPVAGDVNGDKSVTVDDAILVLRHIAGLETLSDSALTAAEMNGDGSVDVNDAIAILSKIAGAN